MKAQHKTKENKELNPFFAQQSKENEDARMEIYRMIYFLNKIEETNFENLFKKFKIQFSNPGKADEENNMFQNLNGNIPSMN